MTPTASHHFVDENAEESAKFIDNLQRALVIKGKMQNEITERASKIKRRVGLVLGMNRILLTWFLLTAKGI